MTASKSAGGKLNKTFSPEAYEKGRVSMTEAEIVQSTQDLLKYQLELEEKTREKKALIKLVETVDSILICNSY